MNAKKPQTAPERTRVPMRPTSPPAPMTSGEKLIRSYLTRSAGCENRPSDHTLRCFLGMVESGEATWYDVRAAGGLPPFIRKETNEQAED